MKIYHFTIIFAVFAVSFFIIRNAEVMKLSDELKEIMKTEKTIEKAVEQAAMELRTYSSESEIETDRKAIASFSYSIWAASGIMGLPSSKMDYMKKVPEIIIYKEDGYRIYKMDWFESDGRYLREYVNSGGKHIYDNDIEYSGISFSAVSRRKYTAGLTDRKKYIVDTEGWYHEEGCTHQGELKYVLYSKQGCTSLGTKACRYCIDK